MLENKFILEALDLGSGFAKFSKTDKSGKVEFKSFPSIAPKAQMSELSIDMLDERDTVVVNVDGLLYEVGPDSLDLDNNSITRVLNENYIFTSQYKAVFYGVLHYMGKETIDLLVVGLPMSDLYKSDQLKNIMIGTHKISEDKTIIVKDVLVLAQPLGGLYYASTLNIEALSEMNKESNLCIDVGYFTFCFLLANGKKIIHNKSSSYGGGVSKVLKAIADSISEKFSIKYENLNAIDKGLENKQMKINGKIEDLKEHSKNTRPVIEGAITYMMNYVGNGADIDNIILFGGGASLFKKTIKQSFASHNIITLCDSSFCVARGYIEAGRIYLKNKQN